MLGLGISLSRPVCCAGASCALLVPLLLFLLLLLQLLLLLPSAWSVCISLSLPARQKAVASALFLGDERPGVVLSSSPMSSLQSAGVASVAAMVPLCAGGLLTWTGGA